METRPDDRGEKQNTLPLNLRNFFQALSNQTDGNLKKLLERNSAAKTLVNNFYYSLDHDSLKGLPTKENIVTRQLQLEQINNAINMHKATIVPMQDYLSNPPVNSELANFYTKNPNTAKFLVGNLQRFNLIAEEFSLLVNQSSLLVNQSKLINKYCHRDYILAVLKSEKIKLPENKEDLNALISKVQTAIENIVNKLDAAYFEESNQKKLNFIDLVSELAQPKKEINIESSSKQIEDSKIVAQHIQNAMNFAKNQLNDMYFHLIDYRGVIENKAFITFIETKIKELIMEERKDVDGAVKLIISDYIKQLSTNLSRLAGIEENSFNTNALSNDGKVAIEVDNSEDKNAINRNSTPIDNYASEQRKRSSSVTQKPSVHTKEGKKFDFAFKLLNFNQEPKHKYGEEFKIYIYRNNDLSSKDKKAIIQQLEQLKGEAKIINILFYLSLQNPNNQAVPKLIDDILRLFIKPDINTFVKLNETLVSANKEGTLPVEYFLYCSQKANSHTLGNNFKSQRKSLFS